jgi:hypothetical protein
MRIEKFGDIGLWQLTPELTRNTTQKISNPEPLNSRKSLKNT